MPRVSEIQAEAAPPRSPLRRSCRVVAVSSPAPSEVKPVKSRRLSTTNNETKDEETAPETNPGRFTRASSVTSESSDGKPIPAKTRTRRSSATTEVPTKEEKKIPAKGRRSSVTDEPTTEMTKTVSTRRSSLSVEETKPVKTRRNSTQEEVKEDDNPKKHIRTRRGSLQEDKDEDSGKKPLRGRRNSTQDEANEELPSRSTRSRRSASRDLFEDIEETKSLRSRKPNGTPKVDEIDSEVKDKRTRTRRGSIDSVGENEDAKVTNTPIKSKRRLSITDNAVPLESIDEKDQEIDSPSKESTKPSKQKQDQIPLKDNLDLSVIAETSFNEDTDEKPPNTARLSVDNKGHEADIKPIASANEDSISHATKEQLSTEKSRLSPRISLSRLEEQIKDRNDDLESGNEIQGLLTSEAKVPRESAISRELKVTVNDSGPRVILNKCEVAANDEIKKITEEPTLVPKVCLNKIDKELDENLTSHTTEQDTSSKSEKTLTELSPTVLLTKLQVQKSSGGAESPEPTLRKSPRLQEKFEKCLSGEFHNHKKCNCDQPVMATQSKRINFETPPESSDIESSPQITKKSPESINLKNGETDSQDSGQMNDSVFLEETNEDIKPNEIKTHLSDGSDGSFQFHLSKSKLESTEDENELNFSKTSDSSDKENIAQNVETSTNLGEKNILGSVIVNNAEVIKIRVSNVFRPKNVDYSFIEPMEVDTTLNMSKLDKTHLKANQQNDSLDETFSLSLNVTSLETPVKKICADDSQTNDTELVTKESKSQERNTPTALENEETLHENKRDPQKVQIEDNTTRNYDLDIKEETVKNEEIVKMILNVPKTGIVKPNKPDQHSTLKQPSLEEEISSTVETPVKELLPQTSAVRDDSDEDDIFEENETKDMSDDYEFDVPSEEEAETQHSATSATSLNKKHVPVKNIPGIAIEKVDSKNDETPVISNAEVNKVGETIIKEETEENQKLNNDNSNNFVEKILEPAEKMNDDNKDEDDEIDVITCDDTPKEGTQKPDSHDVQTPEVSTTDSNLKNKENAEGDEGESFEELENSFKNIVKEDDCGSLQESVKLKETVDTEIIEENNIAGQELENKLETDVGDVDKSLPSEEPTSESAKTELTNTKIDIDKTEDELSTERTLNEETDNKQEFSFDSGKEKQTHENFNTENQKNTLDEEETVVSPKMTKTESKIVVDKRDDEKGDSTISREPGTTILSKKAKRKSKIAADETKMEGQDEQEFLFDSGKEQTTENFSRENQKNTLEEEETVVSPKMTKTESKIVVNKTEDEKGDSSILRETGTPILSKKAKRKSKIAADETKMEGQDEQEFLFDSGKEQTTENFSRENQKNTLEEDETVVSPKMTKTESKIVVDKTENEKGGSSVAIETEKTVLSKKGKRKSKMAAGEARIEGQDEQSANKRISMKETDIKKEFSFNSWFEEDFATEEVTVEKGEKLKKRRMTIEPDKRNTEENLTEDDGQEIESKDTQEYSIDQSLEESEDTSQEKHINNPKISSNTPIKDISDFSVQAQDENTYCPKMAKGTKRIEKRFSSDQWQEEVLITNDIREETNVKPKEKKKKRKLVLEDSVFEKNYVESPINAEKRKKQNIDDAIEDTKSPSPARKTSLTAKSSLEEFAASKLDEYLKRKMADFESEEREHSSDEESSENSFIDDMAEEGEEDTPSEDSNQIIEEGESINSDSERSADDSNDDDNDSFICNNEVIELLSGEEYDLDNEVKMKKSRIINVENRDEDVIKIERKPKVIQKKKRSRIIQVEDSSGDEQIIDLDSSTNNETSSANDRDNSTSRKRNSSIQIIENIDVKEIKDSVLTDRINKLVDTFCTTIPSKGDVSMNLSLEYAAKPSSDEEKMKKKRKSNERKRKSRSSNEELGPAKEPRLSVSLIESDDKSERRKLEKRRLSQSMDDEINNKKDKKKKHKKPKLEELNTKHSNVKSKADLKQHTFGLINQLITDVKNRPRRDIKPGSSKGSDFNASWIIENVEEITPSTSIVSPKYVESFKKSFHAKDFRNQILYNSSRVKRIDSKALLRKKSAYY